MHEQRTFSWGDINHAPQRRALRLAKFILPLVAEAVLTWRRRPPVRVIQDM